MNHWNDYHDYTKIHRTSRLFLIERHAVFLLNQFVNESPNYKLIDFNMHLLEGIYLLINDEFVSSFNLYSFDRKIMFQINRKSLTIYKRKIRSDYKDISIVWKEIGMYPLSPNGEKALWF